MQKIALLKEDLSQVNRSPMNTSKAKAMFSFPKEQRFPPIKTQCNSPYYEKSSTLNRRAPSFGYGQKIDIALASSSPSPIKYTLDSIFCKSPKKGITMGHGRADCLSVSIFKQTHVPGPGEYDIHKDKQNIKDMTMSCKLKFPPLWAESIAPGPGTYEMLKADYNGMCVTSKYSSKGSFKIHPSSPQKQNKIAQLLGPGTYNTNLSATGKQILARNKTETSFHFYKKDRETMKEQTLSPGPGAYNHYSIFGMV